MQPSVQRTVLFAVAISLVCAVMVSVAAVALRDRQETNKLLDQRKKVLTVAGLMDTGESLSAEEINLRFENNLQARVIDLETGEVAADVDPAAYDQRKAQNDPERSEPAAPNPAKVRRVPKYGKVYLLQPEGGQVEGVIIPIEGMGLWSTLYGYIALAHDANTVRGITFYEHGETPGLGGEVDNPRWKALWPDRKVYDEDGSVTLTVAKGRAGTPEADPYRVDGLSGATLTSNGVSNMLRFWLGDKGFGEYLDHFRSETSGGGAE